MKYMGSKRAMLKNGLGTLLREELDGARRFVDLFTGSAAVANHVAQNFDIPVFACDLQKYSIILARAVVGRQRKIDPKQAWSDWYMRARLLIERGAHIPPVSPTLTRNGVLKARRWCAKQTSCPLTLAYGGHYFSPRQAMWIDALRKTLPTGAKTKQVALAALIQAASKCIASPGHTAQPFQPTRSAKRFLLDSWRRSIPRTTREIFVSLSNIRARRSGLAERGDANHLAKKLRKTDLVFVDPPYSGVHYSRFYHVLESIARGRCGNVSGTGRYPAAAMRPRSRYSLQAESKAALDQLLNTISKRGSRVILTFPNHRCSNGLSGYSVSKIAETHFSVKKKSVASYFSSLGGTSSKKGKQAGRDARRDARELMLTLSPLVKG